MSFNHRPVSYLFEDVVNANFGDGDTILSNKTQDVAILMIVELQLVEADTKGSDICFILFIFELADQIVILADVDFAVIELPIQVYSPDCGV